MNRIRCIAVESLPGGGPVAITDRGGVVYVYLSSDHSLPVVAEALTQAVANVRLSLAEIRL